MGKIGEPYGGGMRRAIVLVLLCFYAIQLCGVAALDGEEMVEPNFETSSVLQDHGTYTVAYSEDYSPFSYVGSDGIPAGIAIDIMDYIAQVAGIQVDYISVGEAKRRNTTVDINLAILSEDQIDGNSVKSVPYTSLQMMVVSNSRTLELRDATVGHLSYHYLGDAVVEEALPGCVSHTYFTYVEMAQDFSKGKLDYMLVSSLVSSEMLDTTYQLDTYTIPTAVELEFFMSYGEELSGTQIDALDMLICSLDSDYIYSMMLSSVINASDAEITIEKVLQTYAVPILLSVLFVFLSIAVIMLKGNYNKRMALERALNVDDLTGMMTERKFIKDAVEVLATAKPGEYYIITIDIDHFKFINEIYGYDVGSEAIVVFGNVLREMFPRGTRIARLFADNFVVLYHAGKDWDEQSTELYEENISKAMVELLGDSYRLTTSSGIYQVNEPTLPLSYMVDCANVARRQGKTDYGISKMEFTQRLEQRMRQKNEIVRTMEIAIAEKEFQIYYQPKISLKTGELVGAEALIRWIRPDGQRRYPDEFIPLFESNGFIRRVDFFVLESVCEFLQNNPYIAKISVNFSGLSMLSDDLMEHVIDITERYRVDPSRLEIEITESAVVRNFGPIMRQTTKLKKAGFTISMDDFGAGISSLNRLKDLDIDVLKIDKAFLEEEQLSSRSISIIEHIIRMSQELGITTIAEGVEYREQESMLKTMGCDMAQGYHYARPLPEEEYLKFLQEYTHN